MALQSDPDRSVGPERPISDSSLAEKGLENFPQPAARFDAQEIEVARALKDAGIPWEPAPGQFVLDEKKLIERGSPFQPGVYFILNYERFLSISGGLSGLVESMTWLPTFEQCRQTLRSLGIDDENQVDHLVHQRSFEHGSERLDLYRLILEYLHRDE